LFVVSLASAIWRRDGAVRHGILCCGLIMAMAIPLVAAGLQSMGVGLLPIDVSSPRTVAATGVQASVGGSAAPMIEPGPSVQALTGPNRVDARETTQAEPVETPPAASAISASAQAVAKSVRRRTDSNLVATRAGNLAAGRCCHADSAGNRLQSHGGDSSLGSTQCQSDLVTAFAALARSREIELVVSDRVFGPLAAGIWRPRVVLPSSLIGRLAPDQAQHILTHELTHIARRDQLVVLLQNLLGAIYWIHPLTSLFNRQLAQAREEVW
jgi:hypothetical protein